MRFETKQAKVNSKGITDQVYFDGHLVANLRAADLNPFMYDQMIANQDAARFKDLDRTNSPQGYLTLEFRIKRTIGRDFKCFDDVTLGYSPEGKDLDGRGGSVFVNTHGSCLTSSYDRPKALKLLDDTMILETDHGKFLISCDNRGYYHAVKQD